LSIIPLFNQRKRREIGDFLSVKARAQNYDKRLCVLHGTTLPPLKEYL
jgi:hypothetical protein